MSWSSTGPGSAGATQHPADTRSYTPPTTCTEPCTEPCTAPPYVVAGHSIGGYIARLFAADHPEDVAGVVLIDSSHHDQFHWFPHYPRRMASIYLRERVRPYGLVRLANDLNLTDAVERKASSRVPGVWTKHMAGMMLNDRHRRADIRELLDWPRLAADTGRRAPSLGDIPLTVVTSSELSSDYVTPRQIARRRADYRIWSQLQAELATLSKDSRHIVAENAGHFVHRHDPELVASAILDLVRRARQ
ncbi:alpha/beta fold hydrolase [Nonomuraea turcica]|uniref:alpha/beta fold hydrolase n=1 Tax=Nonomuraea sp. G32 TaxID=3067274 RepID=UPI00273CDEA4|nr:alpha/beta hydrolase [Nonomuraea sp. G32]MDP4501134.1 alpha/beta hydrolase [Nonomuraea sp. G32]